MLKRYNISPKLITPSGKNGRILKEDVVFFLEKAKTPTPPLHAQLHSEHKGVTVKVFLNSG